MSVESGFHGFAKSLTDQWLARQVVNEKDFYDDNDILICGKCGEPRQEFREWPDPTEEEPDREIILKTVRMCKCDRERRAEEKRQDEVRENMERVKALRKYSLMDAKFQNATFDNFHVTKANQKNLKYCKRYAAGFEEMLKKNQGLLLWGGVGTGKSYAAACIANYLLEQKISVVMTSFVKILELIQKDRDEESKIIERLANTKLAIFDDLGAERNTSYALEKVYNIIDSRYRLGLPMILTTNLSLQEMQEETDIQYVRIYDRIFEVCYPMQFTGDSFRRQAAFNKFSEMGKFFESEN